MTMAMVMIHATLVIAMALRMESKENTRFINTMRATIFATEARFPVLIVSMGFFIAEHVDDLLDRGVDDENAAEQGDQ